MLKKIPLQTSFSSAANIVSGTLFSACIVFASATGTVVAQDLDEGDLSFADIAVCLPGFVDVPRELRDAPQGNADDQPVEIEADSIEASDGNRAVLSGNAQILQGNRGVYADRIEYNQETYQATATGDVKLYTPNGDEIRAESMNLEVDTFIGDAEEVSIQIVDTQPEFLSRRGESFVEDYSVFAPFRNRIDPNSEDDEEEDSEKKFYQRARASGESMQFEGKDFERLQNAVMTTCPVGNEDVSLSARELELDHATGIGTAKSMVVRLKNVPIFYFPSVSFPINDERKTGFLFPAIGADANSGTVLEIPYYINIAPQADATIIPRLLTDRGVQLYGELRYIGRDAEGSLKAEVLPDDDEFDGEDRHAIGFDHDQRFGEYWRTQIELQDVSDEQYLRDFANNVDVVASSFVPQQASITRNADETSFSARVRTTESVNDSIAEEDLPYDILPELNFIVKPQEFSILEAGLDTQFIEFDSDSDLRVRGQRRTINPYLSVPFEEIYGYVTPKFSLYDISYSLDNNNNLGDSPSATIPAYSVDSGLTFERLFDQGETPFYQTLEPRLFYLNVPEEEDQDAFPVFDTSETEFSSFGQFFRENRFFGGDRVGDTEQVALGLTSRVVNDETGSQRLKLSIGQVFYLDDREIQLPVTETTTDEDGVETQTLVDGAPDTESRSDIITEVTANYTDDWSFSSFTRWDVDNNELGVIRFSADYFNSERRNLSVAYSETRDVSQQVNLDFSTPLGPVWQLDVETAYSIEDSELRSSLFGLTYDGCCWAVRVLNQRFLDGSGDFRNRILLTLELDDLGKLRSNL